MALATPRPPFRADHVGSLLRPPELKEAHDRAKRGEIDRAAARAVEDRCIRDVVAFQEAVGLQSITDGEFRRDWWHIDFLRGFDGVQTVTGATFGVHFQGADEQPPLMRVTGRIRRTRPSMLDHFKFLKSVTGRTPKFCMPSPAMLHARGDREALRKSYPDLKEFWSDLTQAYREEIHDLYQAGCRYLQIDDTTIAMMGDPKVQEQFRKLGDEPKKDTEMYADAVNAAIRNRVHAAQSRCVFSRVRHGPRRRLRAAAVHAQGKEGRARPDQFEGCGAREERRLETPHRSGRPVRADREPVPFPAMRLLEHAPWQQDHRGRPAAQARAGARGGPGSVGNVLEVVSQ
jgi:methionine synthase II (cobalamin-independent)